MVGLLRRLSIREREKAAAKTRFARVQLLARKLFNSNYFQTGSATLIIAVSRRSPPRDGGTADFLRRRREGENPPRRRERERISGPLSAAAAPRPSSP